MEFIYVKLHIISSPIFKTNNFKVSQQRVKDFQELRKDVNLGSIYG